MRDAAAFVWFDHSMDTIGRAFSEFTRIRNSHDSGTNRGHGRGSSGGVSSPDSDGFYPLTPQPGPRGYTQYPNPGSGNDGEEPDEGASGLEHETNHERHGQTASTFRRRNALGEFYRTVAGFFMTGSDVRNPPSPSQDPNLETANITRAAEYVLELQGTLMDAVEASRQASKRESRRRRRRWSRTRFFNLFRRNGRASRFRSLVSSSRIGSRDVGHSTDLSRSGMSFSDTGSNTQYYEDARVIFRAGGSTLEGLREGVSRIDPMEVPERSDSASGAMISSTQRYPILPTDQALEAPSRILFRTYLEGTRRDGRRIVTEGAERYRALNIGSEFSLFATSTVEFSDESPAIFYSRELRGWARVINERERGFPRTTETNREADIEFLVGQH